MQEVTVKLYSFDELSPEVQQKVIADNVYINVEHDWWDYIFEDAKQIGVEIKYFSLDSRDKHIHINPMVLREETVKLLLENHGTGCQTHLLAKDKELADKEFYTRLGNLYLNLLDAEYLYLCSDAAVTETLQSYDEFFLKNGAIFSWHEEDL